MKSFIGTTLLLSAALWALPGAAQVAAGADSAAGAHIHGPTYSQLYCSGFISKKHISRSTYVLGSKESPHEDRLQGRSMLFLRGDGLTEGERYSIVRQVADPNREDSSPDERQRLSSLGGLYQDIGWVTVRSIDNGTAIASFDFACGAAVPGDLIIPFEERPQISYRDSNPTLPTFLGARAGTTGHILGAREFDALLGSGAIVYTDFGASKGASPGTYLLITRGYASGDMNRIDRLYERLPRGAEITAVNPAGLPRNAGEKMPIRVLGEMLILNTTEHSSTALITRSSSEIGLGDVVHLEEGTEQASQMR
jgi:hypothetical protein